MTQMVMANAGEAYRKQGILTSSPLELVVMLYDGLYKNMTLARRAIGKKNFPGAHTYLMKAQAIIEELAGSLDLSIPMSEGLVDLYDFIFRQLQIANVNKDARVIDETLGIVDELRSAWRTISGSQRVPTQQEAVV